ncbi:MAG: sigma-70 family RNA polymerase sigma factor [Saprospiraceae bacterium]
MIETTTKFWEEIYNQNIKKMIGICYRYTSDNPLAEDLAHDAFVLAHQKVAGYEGKGPFEAWLRRIVVNVCLQHIRGKSKEKYIHDLISNEAVSMGTDFETEHNNYELSHEQLLDAINMLPEHHKLVFNLYVIDKFSHAQIGKELGISEGTSKSHLARARKKIRQILKEKLNPEKKKRKGLFLLFGLPIKLWNIDGLYRKQFKNYEIQNLKSYPLITRGANTVQIPSNKAPFIGNYVYATIATVGFGIFLVTYLNIKKPNPITENIIPNANISAQMIEEEDKIIPKDQDSTATNLKNGIIVNENNFLTNKNDTMKNSKTVAALLLAGSILADSNGQTIKTDTGSSNSKLLIVNNKSVNDNKSSNDNVSVNDNVTANDNKNANNNKSINFGQPETRNFEPISDNASGTFYATNISWSADNNELYFNGKVVVDIEKNKFVGNGSFNFIGKVNYLVVDGKPVQLGSKIKLDENKKYKLTKLSADKAVAKYGDGGKRGAVEIELAK